MNVKYTANNIAFDYPFEATIHRLIMIYIQISGSSDGGKEKVITDQHLQDICCCSSSELIDSVNILVVQGFIRKCNYGLQFGIPANGYTIAVPEHLQESV